MKAFLWLLSRMLHTVESCGIDRQLPGELRTGGIRHILWERRQPRAKLIQARTVQKPLAIRNGGMRDVACGMRYAGWGVWYVAGGDGWLVLVLHGRWLGLA